MQRYIWIDHPYHDEFKVELVDTEYTPTHSQNQFVSMFFSITKHVSPYRIHPVCKSIHKIYIYLKNIAK